MKKTIKYNGIALSYHTIMTKLLFKTTDTCNECVCLSVSISKMETTLSDAAANNCPILGWNLTWAVPPWIDQCGVDSFYLKKIHPA